MAEVTLEGIRRARGGEGWQQLLRARGEVVPPWAEAVYLLHQALGSRLCLAGFQKGLWLPRWACCSPRKFSLRAWCSEPAGRPPFLSHADV